MTGPGSSHDKTTADRPRTRLGEPVLILLLAGIAGLVFGFLLQKGGVAKFDILIGVLLLEELTVLKVMLSAIVVGVAGMTVLVPLGLITPQVKDTVIGLNVVGGVIFGVGFGLMGYCPGTAAAAVGQGNLDAITGVAGLIAGSYLYAMLSKPISNTVGQWGQCGNRRLTDILPLPGIVVSIGVIVLLVIVLAVIEMVS